ncbi:hypothetical protein EVA_04993 [gut metagenome]|uniref:Uncharacterized protein n=1 Tax=gut metagenome TaxID=749906 RepID=J9D2P0_9ZZZZ
METVLTHSQSAPTLLLLYILGELLYVFLCPLGTAAGLVKNYNCVLRYVVYTACHRVDYRQIPVRIGQNNSLTKSFAVTFQSSGKGCSIF